MAELRTRRLSDESPVCNGMYSDGTRLQDGDMNGRNVRAAQASRADTLNHPPANFTRCYVFAGLYAWRCARQGMARANAVYMAATQSVNKDAALLSRRVRFACSLLT